MYCVKCGEKFVHGICPECGTREQDQLQMTRDYNINNDTLCEHCGVAFNVNGICPRCGARKPIIVRKVKDVEIPESRSKKSSTVSSSTTMVVSLILVLSLIAVVFLFLAENEINLFQSQSQTSTNTTTAHVTSATVSTTTGKPTVTYKVGDIITLGSYEQDGDSRNGTEPLEWIVIDVSDDKAFIVSLYALNVKQYNVDRNNFCTWEDCSLRQWLNDEFYSDAFSYDDRSRLLSTSIYNEDNPDYGTSGGNDTYDTIFLLSIDEARQYLTIDQRAAEPTWYSRIQGNYADDQYDNVCWWWLRSVGDNGKKAAYVDEYGNIGTEGNWINLEISVRPAAYISLDV